jgi:hypothetical protein
MMLSNEQIGALNQKLFVLLESTSRVTALSLDNISSSNQALKFVLFSVFEEVCPDTVLLGNALDVFAESGKTYNHTIPQVNVAAMIDDVKGYLVMLSTPDEESSEDADDTVESEFQIDATQLLASLLDGSEDDDDDDDTSDDVGNETLEVYLSSRAREVYGINMPLSDFDRDDFMLQHEDDYYTLSIDSIDSELTIENLNVTVEYARASVLQNADCSNVSLVLEGDRSSYRDLLSSDDDEVAVVWYHDNVNCVVVKWHSIAEFDIDKLKIHSSIREGSSGEYRIFSEVRYDGQLPDVYDIDSVPKSGYIEPDFFYPAGYQADESLWEEEEEEDNTEDVSEQEPNPVPEPEQPVKARPRFSSGSQTFSSGDE